MPRRFKDAPNPQKARADWKKEQEVRQPRRAAPARGGGLAALMQRRAAGPGPGGGGPGGGLDAMRNHPAVRFGQQMTGGVADGPRQAIMNQVLGRLAQRGLSRDATGTWQIAGLNRPTDPGIAIRNSAIGAMDPSGEILRRVLGADARLGEMAGGPTGMPSGMGGVPSPGLGAGSLPIGRANGMPLPPVMPGVRPPDLTRVPTPPGGGMQSVPPGLPGGPPMPPRSGVPGLGGLVPSPGLGGMPSPGAPKPPVSPPFPPQGQGVGRTTTPTGAEIDPTKYPRTDTGGINPTMVPGAQTRHTVPSMPTVPPGGGSPAGFPTLLPPGASTAKPAPSSPMPTAGMAGGLNQVAPTSMMPRGVSDYPQANLDANRNSPIMAALDSGKGGWENTPNAPQSTMPPPSVANDIYRQPGTPPPSQVIPRGGSDYPVSNNTMPSIPPPPSGPPPAQRGDTPGWPQSQMQGYANPAGPLAQRLQQGRPGTPPSPGRAPTPTVAPGSMPGVSTPFNPAQMAQPAVKLPPVPRPTGFGTPGQTTMPQRQPANLANLGQSIQQTVQARVGAAQQGIRPGVSPATPGSPVGNSLDDLGDRIRAAVAGNQGNVQPAAPGGGIGNLGPATQSIMDRVRQQISQAGVGQQMPAPRGPNTGPLLGGITPASPSTGTMPGGLSPQTQGITPAGPSTGTMPGGTPSNIPAPPPSTGAPGQLGSYGNQSVDQWDSAFISAGQQYGIDPRVLKAMAEIESGGNGDIPLDQCRADGSCGLMQVKPGIWGSVGSTEEQIAQAAKILADYKSSHPGATDLDAITGVYFPTDDVMNGTTQGDYIGRVNQLVNQMGPYSPGGDPGTAGAVTGAGGGMPTTPGGMGAPTADPGTAGAITNAGMGGMQPPAGGGAPTTNVGTTPVQPGTVMTNAPAPPIDKTYTGSLNAATSPMAPGQFQPQFIVYHMTDGSSFNGAGSFDQDGDGTPDGSTNYIIDKDGTIYELVPPGSAMPWANGQTQGVAAVNPQKQLLLTAANEDNLNNRSISIEMVGINGEPITPEQMAAGQQLTGYLSGQYNIPLDEQHLVGHADITGDRQDPIGSYDPMDMVPTGAPAPGTGAPPSTIQGTQTGIVNPSGSGAPSSTLIPGGLDPRGAQVADLADNYVNTPYVPAGTDPNGWDCSGFTYYIAQQMGYSDFPQGSHEQYNWAVQNGKLKTDPGTWVPGDVLFFNTGYGCRSGNCVSHVAIYLGGGKIIQALNPGAGTTIMDLTEFMSWYPDGYMGAASMY